VNTLNIKPVTDSDPSVTLTVGGLRKLLREEIKAVLAEQEHQQTFPSNTTSEAVSMPYLTVQEAAKLSRIAVSTVRAYIRKGKLRPQRVGRRIVISRAELEKFLAGTSNKVNELFPRLTG